MLTANRQLFWQCRSGLALAFAGRDKVIFLNEPKAGLDATAREAFLTCARDRRDQGATLVITLAMSSFAACAVVGAGFHQSGVSTAMDREADNVHTFKKFKADVTTRRRRHPARTRRRPAGSGRRPFSGVGTNRADDGGFGVAVYLDDNDFTRCGGVSGKCQNIDVVGHQDHCPGRFLVF